LFNVVVFFLLSSACVAYRAALCLCSLSSAVLVCGVFAGTNSARHCACANNVRKCRSYNATFLCFAGPFAAASRHAKRFKLDRIVRNCIPSELNRFFETNTSNTCTAIVAWTNDRTNARNVWLHSHGHGHCASTCVACTTATRARTCATRVSRHSHDQQRWSDTCVRTPASGHSNVNCATARLHKKDIFTDTYALSTRKSGDSNVNNAMLCSRTVNIYARALCIWANGRTRAMCVTGDSGRQPLCENIEGKYTILNDSILISLFHSDNTCPFCKMRKS